MYSFVHLDGTQLNMTYTLLKTTVIYLTVFQICDVSHQCVQLCTVHAQRLTQILPSLKQVLITLPV